MGKILLKILEKLLSLELQSKLYITVTLGKWPGDRYIRESTKHGPLVHGPPLWTGSMDRVHQNMDRVHGPLSWTGSMDPLFLQQK